MARVKPRWPFAPDRTYGPPAELKALIDRAHGLGMMVFLDVVYNHFGPAGNRLPEYAPQFFRSDLRTPWGNAIDLRQPMVRRFFLANAIYWIHEFRLGGLRPDAVHAIGDRDFLVELAAQLRATVPNGRYVHSFVSFLQNHDQFGNRALSERLTTLAKPDALRAAAALQLLGPQIPLVFMGEEAGAEEPFLYFTDHRDPAALSNAAVYARRRLGDGSTLSIAANLGDTAGEARFPRSIPAWGTACDVLPPAATIAWIDI